MIRELRSRKIIGLLLTQPIVLISTLSYAVGADKECIAIPESQTPAPVEACEGNDFYEIRILDQTDRSDKRRFQHRLQNTVADWVATTRFPSYALCNATIEYWLSVPESSPASTQARVVIKNRYNNFMAYINPWPNNWFQETSNTAILGSKLYPETSGAAAGRLLVKAARNVSKAQLDDYLFEFAALNGEEVSGLWYKYEVEPFLEDSTKDKVKQDYDSSQFVTNVTLNQKFEWLATKRKVFSFLWRCF